jgi:hypothetical protein
MDYEKRCKNCQADCSFAGKTKKDGISERRDGKCSLFKNEDFKKHQMNNPDN